VKRIMSGKTKRLFGVFPMKLPLPHMGKQLLLKRAKALLDYLCQILSAVNHVSAFDIRVYFLFGPNPACSMVAARCSAVH